MQILAPEALNALCVNADSAIDIWAMGVVLYYMVYGQLPFRGATDKEVVLSITKKAVEFPKTRKRISSSCMELITKMLTKNPKARIKMEDIYASTWYRLP